MGNHSSPTALILADTHFHLSPDAAERRRLERFLSLLALGRRAQHVILLGDIFDFWFDYPHFRLKGYEELLQALDAVRAAGARLHFVGGNHDIWAARYLAERYGTGNPSGGPQTLLLDGLRLRCDHGDGLLARGFLYAAFRRVVRHRAGVALGKSLHPEVLYALSSWLSRTSRKASRDEAAAIERRAHALVDAWADPPWDMLAIGHVHQPILVRRGTLTFAALAGWLDAEGYALLHAGRLELRDFRDGPPPELINVGDQ